MDIRHAKQSKRASSKVYVEYTASSAPLSSADPRVKAEHHDAEVPAASAPANTPSPSSTATSAAEPSSPLLSTRPKHPQARLTSRLSHDISTEQLFSDQLIDGKVADGEDDEDDAEGDSTEGEDHSKQRSNNPAKKCKDSAGSAPDAPLTKGMYRIESHSALSSLEAKHIDKQQQQQQPSPTRDGPAGKKESPTSSRSTPSKPHKLSPLPAIVTSPSGHPPPKLATAPASTPTTGVCEKCTSNRDMPPMHCAAYSGHVECLASLLHDDADRLTAHRTNANASMALSAQQQKRHELDKKHRTPLFYACATNRMDCLMLLLQHRGDWRDLPDKQLDTPVHVCCFFGWHECLSKLLDAGADPHVRNAKGFKPSHIAKTKECLELLLTFGDDLLQGDKLSRTPLFVASARNRSPCVEFLCAWNHQTHSWMLEQEDQRGDRAIHAAACNGSVEALEVLLTYGADPLIPNGKGLTPKDLAHANNHLKCVEILAHAEEELARATTWYAPANALAAGGGGDDSSNNNSSNEEGSSTSGKGWIECWDYDSSQPFYYHNLSGKCQWEVPPGFTPQLQQQDQQLLEQQQQQQSASDDTEDDGSEYVWVKKKKQTVCVVTGKSTEWTAVQDPSSKAIYYKNTRTGQSQWEEPDAVQQLQSASGARAAQEATRIWDELEQSRNALAAAIAREKHRQLAAHQQTLENYKLHLRQRKEDMQKREDQARLQQLLPRSSFIRRKKQSMMMKVSPNKGSSGHGLGRAGSVYASSVDDEKLEQICAKEPALDIFLSTYLRLQGVHSLQVLTTEKRFFNCLYHYYIALVDPISMDGLSKSQFRAFLRDAAIIPSTSSGTSGGANGNGLAAPLKLHIVDLIFAQAARADAVETSNAFPSPSPSPSNGQHSSSQISLLHHRQATITSSFAGMGDSHLTLVGFIAAMQIVRERVVTQFESQSDGQQEIDDDEEWFLMTYLLPLTLKLGAKLLTQIRECKELDLEVAASTALQGFLGQHRQLIQQIHRHYSSQEPKLKMLTFRGLSHFTLDFAVLLSANIPALHQLYEAVNWISGNAHTEIISFEKFQQLLTMLASFQLTPSPGGGAAWRAVPGFSSASLLGEPPGTRREESHILEAFIAFFQQLERSPAKHRIENELSVSASKISSPIHHHAAMSMGESSKTLSATTAIS